MNGETLTFRLSTYRAHYPELYETLPCDLTVTLWIDSWEEYCVDAVEADKPGDQAWLHFINEFMGDGSMEELIEEKAHRGCELALADLMADYADQYGVGIYG